MSEQIVESFDLGQCIPLHYHHIMLVDEARTKAFKESIELLVAPGAKVVELGGGTGILSFFAAQKASKVWYVEINPDLYKFAKENILKNQGHEKIELINMDAALFIPPEPVDVVICEMLHVGMLREKQLNVIDAFKKNYIKKFGLPLPRFIPEAAALWVQPCQSTFNFQGYHCPIITFHDIPSSQESTVGLGDPLTYLFVEYRKEFPLKISYKNTVNFNQSGLWNSVRFSLRNLIGIIESQNRSIDWFSSHLILPLPTPVYVQTCTSGVIEFNYEAGGSIASLAESLKITTIDHKNELQESKLMS